MDDSKGPGKAEDISESSIARSEFTRRGLLQGAAVTPVLLSETAWAADPIKFELDLSLSQNDRVLTVVERPIYAASDQSVSKKKEGNKSNDPSWVIRAVMFGPKAWFALIKPTSEHRRILKVSNCSYGNQTTELTFEFSRKDDTSPWFVEVAATIWNRSRSGKIAFASFAQATTPLRLECIGSNQIDVAVRRIFQNHVHIARQAAATCDVWFDSQLQWTVTATSTRTFSVFGGQAWLKDFSFGWRTDLDLDTDKIAAGDVFLQGRGALREDGVDNAKIVVGAGHCVDLTLQQQPDVVREFEVRIGFSPLDPGVDQTVSRLTLGQGRIAVMDGSGTVAGKISSRDLVLSQTALPKSHSLRTVMFGSAGLAADPAARPTLHGEEIVTPIGRLTVAALPPDRAAKISEQRPIGGTQPAVVLAAPKIVAATQKKNEQLTARKRERELFFRAACGDRGGAREATLWVVDDLRSGQPANSTRPLRRFAMDLQLQAANAALRDVSFSSLVFPDQGSDLRLIFEDGSPFPELEPNGELPRARPSGFVWVGANPRKLRGEIDLSRATLTAARDYDLVKLRFRFFDFVLAFTPHPVIRPARADCRLIQTKGGHFEDNRPVLVAEFDAQHVFEEALFRPDPPSIPDVEIKDSNGKPITRETILAKLAAYKTDVERVTYRKTISDQKKDTEKKAHPAEEDQVFGKFSGIYADGAKAAGLPDDQQIYVGPYALDPDAMHLARELFKSKLRAAITKIVSGTFDRVVKAIPDLKADSNVSPDPKAFAEKASKRLLDVNASNTDMAVNLSNALRNEQIFEQLEPQYAVFRSFYRDERSRSPDVLIPDPVNPLKPLKPTQQLLWLTEYLSEGNRPDLPPDKVDYPTVEKRKEWFDQVFPKFMNRVVGADPIDDLMAGRLSGPSRLAFRVNCAPPPNATSLEAGLNGSSAAGPSAPGGGDFAYKPIEFTFEALTDWSRHEPAVTRRAQKLFTALPWGVVPPLGERAANLGDHDILAYQGFTKGFITAEQRLGEIRSSMACKPTEFETAIEIPSRLILSTAQDAIWQTIRHLPASATELNDRKPPPLKPKAPSLESGLHQQVAGEISVHQAALWTARLAVEDINPGLRIVDTPDFRPMALAPLKTDGLPPLPGRGAPPRGPLAPWFVGPEQMESTTVSAEDINGSLPVNAPGRAKGEVCPAPSDESPSVPDKVFRILKWLCGRAAAQKDTPIDWRMFRTTLDAYDRHQLVMLSSAYGLPVIGRRQAVGDDVEAVGPLIVDSGQFEPGTDQEYALSDARNDQAIYRPVPLSVRELSLTALGGSFSHDTAFQPSAGADDLWGRKLFEGFSIERWQQEIVLGRDIIGQVVYKGYLFPFGHPASMIKQTERIFLHTPKQGIKAILRQRIFLHVAQPLQRFPATGQPHRGALWCGESVTLRTIWTPDILDPNIGNFDPNDDESLNGRINLGAGNPGLAFFPRTDITERGLVSFELLVDGAATRMPLVFVDNIAATTPGSLGELIKHYEDKTKMPISRRTLAMNSQKIRYAPERNSGDTTLTTESIQVTAHGRFKDFGGGWAGDLSTYNTTGTLEGARQPPFYPAMDFAIIRLEQVERFSGGNRKPVKVQYDGHYVRHGFAPIPPAEAKGDEAEPEWNPMEVFLDLRNIVTSSMGDNGAQAAAIGRPASNIVAVSRAKGPLGADRFVKYEKIGDDNPKSQAPESQTTTVHIQGPPEGAVLLTEEGWQKLGSLASYFNHRLKLTATMPGGAGSYPDVERPEPGPVDVVELPPKIPEDVLKTLQVLQSYFSGDAKLLGTVKIKHLLALLGLDDFLAGVPVLRETIEYGTAALAKVNEEAGDLATDVRTRVIHPLRQVVAKLRAQWTALDATLAAKVGQSPNSGLTLAKLYPEIDSGLSDLERTLQTASSQADPAALARDLAIVYESGRRFIRVLTTIAANPVERLKDAATRAIDNLVSGFTGDFRQLAEFKAIAKTLVEDARTLAAADIQKWINDNVDEAELAEQLSPIFSQPDLVAFGNSLSESLDPAAKEFLDKTSNGLKEALPTAKELVELLSSELPAVLSGKKPEDAFKDAVNTWITNGQARLTIAIEKARNAIKAETLIKVESLREALLRQLDGFTAQIKDWVDGKAAENAFLIDAVIRALNLYAEVNAIWEPAKSGDIKGAFKAVSVFASDAFGYDIQALAADAAKDYVAQIDKVRQRVKNFAAKITESVPPAPTANKELATELAACVKFESDSTSPLPADKAIPPSLTPLAQIAAAVLAIDSLKTPVADFGSTLGSLQPTNALNGIKTFHTNLTAFIDTLNKNTKDLYCANVDALVLLNEVKEWFGAGAWTSLDRNALDQLMRFKSRVEASIKSIETALVALAKSIADFFGNNENKPYIAISLLAGGATRLLEITTSGSPAFVAAQRLQITAVDAEAKVAVALATTIGFIFRLSGDGSLFGAQIAEDLQKAVSSIKNGMNKVDRDLGNTADDLEKSLNDLHDKLKRIATYKLPKPPAEYKTITQLRDENVEGLGKTVKDLLGNSSVADSELGRITGQAHDAEQRALATWRLLQLKLKGIPDQLRGKLEELVIKTGAFEKLAKGYKELLRLRLTAIDNISSVPLLSSRAKRALIVAPLYSKDCKIDDAGSVPRELAKCDRLSEEAAILEMTALPLSAENRNRTLGFLHSWAKGTAAPLTIAVHVRDLAAEVLKGDILSLIDVSAFRDAIDDAIANLIPTRTTLAYDFSRTIKDEPSKTSLFQPQKGSVFGLKVRAVVDLLNPSKVDFRATGSLGPFDVKLVGSLIDALTLKFDGAIFEMVGGSSPHFDVAYKDFEIGKDLEFAKQLQSFLTPKDGNGVFLQPLTRTAGIEAGYGIDLGSIGVGVTSFFNVTLNVSAELPFTDKESLFKVSLGRRLRPFTMSVIPFAGSGYFSIFAAPDGIRGFEASFEFGGGASLGYGPLQAQVRVMVGVFVRVLRVDNTNTCTIYGTFFAGGSASIWIFSFSASLYVRLGRGDDGTMYGEATYSFSFSLGIADYDYTITAFRREQPVGGGKGKKAALLEPSDFDEPIRFALAGDSAVTSDANPQVYAPRRTPRPAPRPYGTTPLTPPTNSSDVMSLAVGPDKNLKSYLSYFDLSLLDGA